MNQRVHLKVLINRYKSPANELLVFLLNPSGHEREDLRLCASGILSSCRSQHGCEVHLLEVDAALAQSAKERLGQERSRAE